MTRLPLALLLSGVIVLWHCLWFFIRHIPPGGCLDVFTTLDPLFSSHNASLLQLKSKVGEVMSSPALTLTPDKTVMDAAVLMLKMKIHRIPVLNAERQVIGMVTRTDIFQALEAVEV